MGGGHTLYYIFFMQLKTTVVHSVWPKQVKKLDVCELERGKISQLKTR